MPQETPAAGQVVLAPLVSVVDDDESVCRAVARLVRSQGLRVETFSSAEEFLAGGSPQGSACLILDLRLPGMSGLELQGRLAERQCPRPVVFVTAHDAQNLRRRVGEGTLGVLSKPFAGRELLDLVLKAVRGGCKG